MSLIPSRRSLGIGAAAAAVAIVATSSFAAHVALAAHHSPPATQAAAIVPAAAPQVPAKVVGPSLNEPGHQKWATKNFPKNKQGLTYGSDADANGPDHMPDLIAVVNDAGQEGFARKTDLLEATGDPSLFSSPAQALAWQRAHTADSTIPLFDLDGTTKIGSLVVHHAGECATDACKALLAANGG